MRKETVVVDWDTVHLAFKECPHAHVPVWLLGTVLNFNESENLFP
jgi:hypothetical protein